MIRLHVVAFVLMLAGLICSADAAPPVRSVLGGDIRDVTIDPAGRAIFESTQGDWRATAEAVYAGKADKIGGAKILLIDHLKRIWLRPDADTDQQIIQMFDGKAWLTRKVSDIPAGKNRELTVASPISREMAAVDGAALDIAAVTDRAPRIQFIGGGVEDSAGNVWFADGDHLQGWWLHQFSTDSKWTSTAVHERALTGVSARRNPTAKWLNFAEPKLQIGPDGLFYISWSSTRLDGGPGMGASGFAQFDGTKWSEYFYPTGSSKADNVQGVIPLPDGSVGFIRLSEAGVTPLINDQAVGGNRPNRRGVAAPGKFIPNPDDPASNSPDGSVRPGDFTPPAGEPRVVWMTSALSRPVPDLTKYFDRLSDVSAHERDTAQAELIAMGPRVRKAVEELAAQTDDPEIKSRLPTILQEIAKPPVRGLYGGRLTFSTWRFLFQSKTGRVFLAVTNCKDLSTGTESKEALVTISPEGAWSAAAPPVAGRGMNDLDLFEDSNGRRWYRILKFGILIDDGKAAPRKISDDADAPFRGVDAKGRMYVKGKTGVVMLDPAGLP